MEKSYNVSAVFDEICVILLQNGYPVLVVRCTLLAGLVCLPVHWLWPVPHRIKRLLVSLFKPFVQQIIPVRLIQILRPQDNGWNLVVAIELLSVWDLTFVAASDVINDGAAVAAAIWKRCRNGYQLLYYCLPWLLVSG